MESQVNSARGITAAQAIQFVRTAAVLLIAYAGIRGCLYAYEVTSSVVSAQYRAFLIAEIEKEVGEIDLRIDPKKGTVLNIGEMDKEVLGRQLYIALNQYRSCVADMHEIGSRASLFSSASVEAR